MWESFTEWASQFFNQPVVISLTTVLTVIGAVFGFLSKTSFGKKAIRKLTELAHRTEKTAKQAVETAEAHKKAVEEQVLALKAEYEQKIAFVLSIANFYEQSFFEIAALIPNAKVQAKVSEIREVYEAKKKVIENEIGLIYDDFETAVEERAKTIEEIYAKKYETISTELENLKLQLQPFQKTVDEIVVNDEYPIPLDEEEVDDGQENENTEPEEKAI